MMTTQDFIMILLASLNLLLDIIQPSISALRFSAVVGWLIVILCHIKP